MNDYTPKEPGFQYFSTLNFVGMPCNYSFEYLMGMWEGMWDFLLFLSFSIFKKKSFFHFSLCLNFHFPMISGDLMALIKKKSEMCWITATVRWNTVWLINMSSFPYSINVTIFLFFFQRNKTILYHSPKQNLDFSMFGELVP